MSIGAGIFLAAVVLALVTLVIVFGLKYLASKAAGQENNLGNSYVTPARKRVGFMAGPETFLERMGHLDPDAILEIRDPRTGKLFDLQVVTVETLHGRRQYRGSSEWVRSGDDWPAVLCRSGSQFSKTEILILYTGTGGYLFRTRITMAPERAEKFASCAQQFGRNGQEPGSVSLTYAGKGYDIQDIGVWDVTAKDYEPHIEEDVIARWIIAVAPDGSALLVEDSKGPKDSIWEGDHVDLDSLVEDILTANG